jgi:DNA polymerase-1
MKTFYLIDGHSQIFRAYYAPFNILTSPSGEPVKATLIFTQMLLAILRERKPDYLALTMDVSDSTTKRAAEFEGYKSNRDRTPEDLPPQVDRIVQIVEMLGVPIYRLSGYEADDLIATIAERLAAAPGHADVELRVVSRDKDLYQIISERVKLWDPVKDEVIDAASLEAKHGFGPRQAVEVQTLMGDAIDNIPGVQGVGLKTAATLIRKYGTADAVIERAEELTPKLRESVRAFAPKVDLSRKLVTLERDAPIEFDLEACRVKPVPFDRLRPIFQGLGFRRLLEQLDQLEAAARARGAAAEGGAPAAGAAGEARQLELFTAAPEGRYTLVDTERALDDLIRGLSSAPILALDTETTSRRPRDAELVGLAFSWKEGEGRYVPLRSRRSRTLDPGPTLARLRPILEDPHVKKVGHGVKFDIQSLRGAGIELAGLAFDSLIASYLLRPEGGGHGLDELARDVLGHRTIPLVDLIGKGKEESSLLDVETRRVADHAGDRAAVAWRLHEALAPRIEDSPMRSLYHDVELPLTGVLASMEWEGIRIDCDLLRSIRDEMSRRIAELEAEIHRAAGREFLIDSPKQLGEVLFDELKLRSVRRTKTSRSTDADVLETLAVETAHPLPRLILEYRELAKLRSTYVDPLPQLLSPATGRLHPSFHQTVAATGRLSSSDPNIQNIPIRTEQGRAIRKAFVPRDRDHVLVIADYSQIELRILAHLSRDEALMEAFEKDQDIHASVASQVAGVPIGEVTRAQRTKAKAVNFGIIYGQGAFGLARGLGISKGEAAGFIAAYKARYPGIVRFMAGSIAEAERTGKVSTLLGRQRPIPEIHSQNRSRRALGERLAVNTIVQGTAADMIKVAMVRIHERLRREELPAHLLIQVHDELVLEAPRELAPETAELARQEMCSALPLSVPLRVDVAWGDNWLEAKH